MSVIKVKAFAVLFNEARDAHLVWRARDPEFHRLLGGHLEFGESTLDGVRREVLEETGAELLNPQLLGVLESRFVHRGKPGHEIVFVYSGTLSRADVVPVEGGWLADNGEPIWVEWRPVTGDPTIPLYPDGTQDLITTSLA